MKPREMRGITDPFNSNKVRLRVYALFLPNRYKYFQFQ